MLQRSNSDQPAQTAGLMRVVIVGKTICDPEKSIWQNVDSLNSLLVCADQSVFAVAADQMFIFSTKTQHTCMIKCHINP